MADILSLNALSRVKNVKDYTDDIKEIRNSVMSTVSHHSNMVDIFCTSCGFTVPSTATEMKIEMWGQGGGGAGSCCCQWGVYGGRGGDYGRVTIDISDEDNITMCGCGCHNSTCCYSCIGSTGAHSRLCWCSSTTPKVWCAKGGQGGLNNCHWLMSGTCNCNLQYSIKTGGAMSLHQSCATCSTFHNCTGTGVASMFDNVNCECFDTYKRGACGFSGLETDTCCQNAGGIGGASYAGGAPQYCNQSMGNWAHTGYQGNFPGGGGSGAGACGGGCCYGSTGGFGLIRVSWN